MTSKIYMKMPIVLTVDSCSEILGLEDQWRSDKYWLQDELYNRVKTLFFPSLPTMGGQVWRFTAILGNRTPMRYNQLCLTLLVIAAWANLLLK
ncbi:MAG: hypothetical protein CM15mP10_1020 [Actinomycetota bacterium]|nr:MAG: hypothetical protein CM15mP10_1020 [Actinomycetota bacterium]